MIFSASCDIIAELRKQIRVWRSLVARLNGVQEAAGSTPVTRTTEKSSIYQGSGLFLFFDNYCFHQKSRIKVEFHYFQSFHIDLYFICLCFWIYGLLLTIYLPQHSHKSRFFTNCFFYSLYCRLNNFTVTFLAHAGLTEFCKMLCRIQIAFKAVPFLASNRNKRNS